MLLTVRLVRIRRIEQLGRNVSLIELFMFQSMMVILKVNGLFKEQATTLDEEDLMLGFSRTFVLKRVADGAVCFVSMQ